MKANFENLEKLERKAQKSCNNCKNLYNWYDTIGGNYRSKWNVMMIELRGWSEYEGDKETKIEWIKYCEKRGSVHNYNFGDILA